MAKDFSLMNGCPEPGCKEHEAKPATVTKREVAAAVEAVAAVAEAIRELGSVPSGHLYAASVMPAGIELATYERILGILKGAGLVAEDGSHMLTWVGPKVGA